MNEAHASRSDSFQERNFVWVVLVIALISGAGLVSHAYAGRSILLATAVPFAGGGIMGLGIGTWGVRVPPLLSVAEGARAR